MNAFADEIRKYHAVENIEIELRLGKVNHGTFDTNVGPHIFGTVIKGLDAYTGWEEVTMKEDEVYYWGHGIRCRYSDTESITERKNSILKKNCTIGPVLDVRLGIAQEIPVEMPTDDATRAVHRHRKSYLRKNVRIDCTVVTGPPEDKDSESTVSYQIELEILRASTDQEIFSALHKVHDLLKLI
jgi:hypothetical protein